MLYLYGCLFCSTTARRYAIMVLYLAYFMEQRKRKSRYMRLPAGERQPMRLTEKDVDILKLFAPGQYNYLTAELIAASTDRPLNRAQHRLRQLYDSGILNRYHPPYERIGGSSKIVYFLDHRGARALTQHFRESVKPMRNFDPDSYHPFMEHILLTNWFRVLVRSACRKKDRVEIPYYFPDDYFSFKFKHPDCKARFNIDPDFFFGMKIGDRPTVNFFVEAQRPTRKTKESSKQQLKNIRRKFQAYFLFWKAQAYRAGDIARVYPEVTNWNNVRVLILTDTGDKEHENLINLARRIDKRGRGVRLFLFAKRRDFELSKPEGLFSNKWCTPVEGDRLYSILE